MQATDSAHPVHEFPETARDDELVQSLVDLQRYPIHKLHSSDQAQQLVLRARQGTPQESTESIDRTGTQ